MVTNQTRVVVANFVANMSQSPEAQQFDQAVVQHSAAICTKIGQLAQFYVVTVGVVFTAALLVLGVFSFCRGRREEQAEAQRGAANEVGLSILCQ